MTAQDDLHRQLTALGVRRGDALMLHVSMRAVGPVPGGADGLLDALQSAVGAEGALMMVLYADDEACFDARTSPAAAELGVVAEVFRRRPGVVVSDHPVSRFGAWGAGAAELVLDPPLHDYYGPGSPLERLVERRGKVLRLGADRDTVTLFHLAEYLADVPDKRRLVHEVVVASPDGRREVRVSCLDDSSGIRAWPGRDYFIDLLEACREAGSIAEGVLGGARAELLDAGAALRVAVGWLEASLGR
jgi:aminoglycoside N3'-acetyltransferase